MMAAMKRRVLAASLFLLTCIGSAALAADSMAFVDAQLAAHPGQSGTYVLDTGEEALIARAWLTDHAQHAIDIQYFIWSTDNIGTLAAEAILRAAQRGVHVRIIVDDLLLDAPDKSLLALDKHSNIDIHIYNPKTSAGVPLQKQLLNVASDLRGVNQRMHDKTFMVDGKVAIVGGRNVAAEYYDRNHEYNFRDRDALVAGAVVTPMEANFENFWNSALSFPVENLYDGDGLTKKNVKVDTYDVEEIYRYLHEYAALPENFAPEVRAAIADTPTAFARLAKETQWGRVDFIHDLPGKNSGDAGFGGGGLTTSALAKLMEGAQHDVLIQSPYLVLSEPALELFRKTLARGVRIRINTNSLASTDNLPAFGGYRSQRRKLLKMGLKIFEYRPDAWTQRRQMQQVSAAVPTNAHQVVGLHAKTLVVDSKVVFIGTYNLDPRSENLNTEVGVLIHNEEVAKHVANAIEIDMQPVNSWNAADDPDQHVSWMRRNHVRMWQLLPIKPLL
jgi:putative cardiolipin synthase